MKEEENKYKEIISALKSLPKKKAKSDFEQKLYRKLRSAEAEKITSPAFEKLTRPKESNWVFNIFRPSLVPAIGLTIVLIAVIVVYINFMPTSDELSETEQVAAKNEEMVIKDPGSVEKSDTELEPKSRGLITHDISGSTTDQRSRLQEGPTSDAEESPAPTISQPEEIDGAPVMEQKIERKETDETIFEKEGKLEKKTDETKKEDMKKSDKKEPLKTKKSDEELNLKKNIGDDIFKSGVQPSMKGRSKDSLKTDSVETEQVKGEEDTNGQVKQKIETERQAEPVKLEPDKKE